jgi:hypothetical protein
MARQDEQIPIQPVENPILCSPYKEPDQHWFYDTRTGIPSKTPGEAAGKLLVQDQAHRQRPNVTAGRG